MTQQTGRQVAVITGAGSGIGAALCERAAGRGMTVVAADIDPERLKTVADPLIAAGAEVVTAAVDVTDADAVDALADTVYDRFGHVSLLVNNAGVESLGRLWQISPAEWRAAMAVNVGGIFHGVRSFVPRMGADPRPSRVVNTTSVGGIGTLAGMGLYGVGKHAAQQLTETLYLECAADFPQIAVSVFCPAHVRSRIFDDLPAADHNTEAAAHWQGQLREKGMDAGEAARIFFDGVDEGRFWILTHPEIFDRIAGGRARLLAERLRPDGEPDR